MEKRKNINVPAVIMMVVLMIGCTEQNYDTNSRFSWSKQDGEMVMPI